MEIVNKIMRLERYYITSELESQQEGIKLSISIIISGKQRTVCSSFTAIQLNNSQFYSNIIESILHYAVKVIDNRGIVSRRCARPSRDAAPRGTPCGDDDCRRVPLHAGWTALASKFEI